jgi:hypothetical protein
MADNKNFSAMKPKLRRAFVRLKDEGIIAKMNFSISLSNGIAEIHDPDYRGYCFYHRQDHERAREEGTVMLAFGVFATKPKDPEIVAVGKQIKKALLAEKLFVDWSGSPDSRIEVHLSKAAKLKKEKDDLREYREREKAKKKTLAKLDIAGFDQKLLAAVAALDTHMFGVDSSEYYQDEKKVQARAKEQDRYFATLPLGGPTLDENLEATIFIRSPDGSYDRFQKRLAVWLKNELKKQGIKARVQSGMVMVSVV